MMHHIYRLSPVVAAIAIHLSNPAYAATPLVLQNTGFTTVQEKFSINLPHTMSGTLKKNGSMNALVYVKKNVDKNSVSHIRMQQTYAGFAVHGGYAILHASNGLDGNVSMNGTLYEGLQTELGMPAKDFAKRGKLALEAFKKAQVKGAQNEGKMEPVIYIDDQNKAHWAYKVSVRISPANDVPKIPAAILDADTFQPFISWNEIKTAMEPVQGYGYGGNPKLGRLEYGQGALAHLDMSRDPAKNTCTLENPEVKTVDMKGSWDDRKKSAMLFNCTMTNRDGMEVYSTGYKADGYDKKNGAYNATNDAHYAGFVIKHMYKDWYDLDALTKADGSPLQLVMRVHYGSSYENAYWDPDQMHMTFGDGAWTFYPLVSLGVAAHEVSHGFTQQHADLVYWGQSGGMNESFSDMAAQAAEYYSTGVASWMIGAEIVKPGSGLETLRYMDVPSKDGSSIDSADQYRSGLDVHYSSGVYNRMFYLLANTEGWTVRTAFDVMVKANADYWTPYTNFKDGGCGVLNAAQDLKLSLDDVRAALDKVAIDSSACMLNTMPVNS